MENYTYYDYHENDICDKCHNKGLLKECDQLHEGKNNCKAVDDLIDIIFYYECIWNGNHMIAKFKISVETSCMFVIENRHRAQNNIFIANEWERNNSGNARFYVCIMSCRLHLSFWSLIKKWILFVRNILALNEI